eukprot:GHVH01017072.1.p1 GENE.GHVH01017072.1~~GHVH01017072.1.p1  ORF type:complete len:412 (+),score=29.36 GHVH01017072.1:879-2114(+)
MVTIRSAASNFARVSRGLVAGEPDAMSVVFWPHPAWFTMESSCAITMNQIITPGTRLPITMFSFAAVCALGWATHKVIYPSFCRLLQWLTNDYEGMFNHSDWRFRCCPLKSDAPILDMGFAHPSGYEKWAWDFANHLLSGVLFLLGYLSGKQHVTLAAVVMNSGMCDVHDFIKWYLGGRVSGQKNDIFKCSNYSTFRFTGPCHFPVNALMFHHVMSLACFFVVVYLNLYGFASVGTAYFMVLVPGTLPVLMTGLLGQLLRSESLVCAIKLTATIFCLYVRIDGFYLLSLYALKKCCLSVYYDQLLPPLSGLACFSVFAALSSFLHAWPFPISVDSSEMPRESCRFPLARKVKKTSAVKKEPLTPMANENEPPHFKFYSGRSSAPCSSTSSLVTTVPDSPLEMRSRRMSSIV